MTEIEREPPITAEREREIVDDLKAKVVSGNDEYFAAFLKTPRKKLVRYHHSLGQKIRNDYGLWKHEWTPELIGHIDNSPQHPDQVSFRIIVALWESMQTEQGEKKCQEHQQDLSCRSTKRNSTLLQRAWKVLSQLWKRREK